MNIGMEFTLILRDAELAARNADPISATSSSSYYAVLVHELTRNVDGSF